jgi:hypothetical protein
MEKSNHRVKHGVEKQKYSCLVVARVPPEVLDIEDEARGKRLVEDGHLMLQLPIMDPRLIRML